MTGTAAAPAVFARVERFADRRVDERRRPRLARGRRARGLPRGRRRADGGPRPPRPDVVGAARRRTPRLARLPPDVAAARPDLAAGRDGRARDGRRRRGRRRAAGRRHPAQVAERPRDRGRRARTPCSSASSTREAAATRLAAPVDLRKLAGILGESEGLGTDDPRVVVGIGINADWRERDFPPDLAGSMTSLREASGGRPIDREALLAGFADRLELADRRPAHGLLRPRDLGRAPGDDRAAA